jgi:hypothetical protein
VNACVHCAHPRHAPGQHYPGNTPDPGTRTSWLTTMVQELTLNPATPVRFFVIIGSDDHSIWLAQLPLDSPGIALLQATHTELLQQQAATGRRSG